MLGDARERQHVRERDGLDPHSDLEMRLRGVVRLWRHWANCCAKCVRRSSAWAGDNVLIPCSSPGWDCARECRLRNAPVSCSLTGTPLPSHEEYCEEGARMLTGCVGPEFWAAPSEHCCGKVQVQKESKRADLGGSAHTDPLTPGITGGGQAY